MSTVDLDATTAGRGLNGSGWLSMIKDLLAFIGSGGAHAAPPVSSTTDTGGPRDEGPDDEGQTGEVMEAFHPMLVVHYASPQF